MAWMASARMASALAMTASSSLSSHVTICCLKVLISANSAVFAQLFLGLLAWSLQSRLSPFGSVFVWYGLFSSSSASSFSRRLSRLVLTEISALASRVAVGAP